MGTELSQPLVDLPTDLAPAKYYDEAQFEGMSSAGFLPRVSLCGAGAELAKMGKIPIAHFALVHNKETFDDLGETVNLIPLSLRFCALRFGAGEVTSYYDPNSEGFKKIVVDSEEPDSGCMYGPQFLVWVAEAPKPCFATFLFGSKSTRREARNMKPLLGHGASLKAKFVKTPKYSWHVPVVLAYSSALVPPDTATARDQINKFNNPDPVSVEKDEEAVPNTDPNARPQ